VLVISIAPASSSSLAFERLVPNFTCCKQATCHKRGLACSKDRNDCTAVLFLRSFATTTGTVVLYSLVRSCSKDRNDCTAVLFLRSFATTTGTVFPRSFDYDDRNSIPSFVRYDDRNSTLKNSTLFPRLSACLVRSSTSLVPVTGTTMYFLLLLVSRLVVVPRRSNKPVAYFRLVPSFELGYFRLVPSFE